MTNQVRRKENLPPLKINLTLTEVARGHSANMARKGQLNHDLDGKKPNDRVRDAGYLYSWTGENIAYSSQPLVKRVFQGWMDSQGHRENILRPHYREIGIGVVTAANGTVYYTQVFGSPR